MEYYHPEELEKSFKIKELASRIPCAGWQFIVGTSTTTTCHR